MKIKHKNKINQKKFNNNKNILKKIQNYINNLNKNMVFF